MCFESDCDWRAEVWTQTEGPAEKACRCMECGAAIPVGSVAHRIHAEQYEECRTCYLGECDCPDDGCCKCAEPELGEVYDYARCAGCHAFLDAVAEAEHLEGCHYSEAVPPLELMHEALHDAGPENCERYFDAARRLHPRLQESGWLDRLRHDLFGEE